MTVDLGDLYSQSGDGYRPPLKAEQIPLFPLLAVGVPDQEIQGLGQTQSPSLK